MSLHRWLGMSVVIAMGGFPSGLQAQQSHDLSHAGFHFVRTSARAEGIFTSSLARCAALSPSFRDVAAALADTVPIDVEVSDTVHVVFGGTYQPDTYSPFLRIRLHDMLLLPMPDETATWAPDSSWAMTRCEALGHELAELQYYRDLWVRLESSTGDPLELFGRRMRIAHSRALDFEAAIAASLRGDDSPGSPKTGRTGVCFVSGAVHVLIGPNTETWNLRDGLLTTIAYNRNTNFCSWP